MGMADEYTVHGRSEYSRKLGLIGLLSVYTPHDNEWR